jgi:HD-GYP domain-containing protein (c-di-GMP phosphodiesterase class II)
MINHNPSKFLQSPIRLAEVLAALSLATDLGTGKPMGHAMRACYLGMQIADQMRLSTVKQAELYYGYLLMHSGCTALSLGLTPAIQGDELAAIGDLTLQDDTNLLAMLNWMRKNVSPDAPLPTQALNIIAMLLHSHDVENHARGVCEVAVRVAQRLGMPPGVQEAVQHYLERWDGKGPYRLQGNEIPLSARLLHTALKIEAFTTARGRSEAEAMLIEQRGKIFDPQVVDAFLEVAKNPNLWENLDKQELSELVLDLEPDSPFRNMNVAKLDDVALAVADFVDLKSPLTVGHSRGTARIAEGIARKMGLPPAEVATIRQAALVHDLGQIALPGSILLVQGQLSDADMEKLRLHPYYTERILSRVPALAEIASIAGKHHERMDGSGYYRGLSGNELPVGACILAVADEFQERVQAYPAQHKPDPSDVLKAMQPDVGTLFSPECFEALAQELGAVSPKPPRRRQWPAGLTDREVEVLRVVATGASNRQIAQELVVSEKTVAHHLEHIYNKIGISSRAAAVFFAMEHDLIS